MYKLLSDTAPDVVHIYGHMGDAGIALASSQQSEAEHAHLLETAVIDAVIDLHQRHQTSNRIRCVLLTGCLSGKIAEHLAENVPWVIHGVGGVTYQQALTYSTQWYTEVLLGKDVITAHKIASGLVSVEHIQMKIQELGMFQRGRRTCQMKPDWSLYFKVHTHHHKELPIHSSHSSLRPVAGNTAVPSTSCPLVPTPSSSSEPHHREAAAVIASPIASTSFPGSDFWIRYFHRLREVSFDLWMDSYQAYIRVAYPRVASLVGTS